MSRTLYSKFAPGVTAEVFTAPDPHGMCAGLVTDPTHEMSIDGLPFAALIKLEEWSDEEVAPVPDSVPLIGYLVMGGEDPALPEYVFYETEKEAKKHLKTDGWGYVTVGVPRVLVTH
jgi:hypothetical protein